MSNRAKLAAAIGTAAVALAVPVVMKYEGTVLGTYKDPIGIVTACTGHVGPELQMGQRFTRAQCEEMLYQDLVKHAGDLECIRRPLQPHETAALLSFTFNVGRAKFCGSTLARKANAGDMRGACAELSRWVLAGGRELPGLVRRRAHERALCEGRLS